MKIDIKATNLELTPAIREYIEIKIGSLSHFLKRFETPKESPEGEQVPYGAGKLPTGRAKNEIEVFVEIARTTRHHRSGNVFYAEASFSIGKKLLRAEHSDWDIRVAIDEVKDRLQQEIKKYKEIKVDIRNKK
jgi:putative sigma-54 modulation protein